MFNVLYTTSIGKGIIFLDKREVSFGSWFYSHKIDEMIKENPNDFAHGCLSAWEKYRGFIGK